MKIVSSLEQASGQINAIIYGVTGAGKTRLAGSAQASQTGSPGLLINVDGGLLTISRAGINMDVVEPSSWAEIQEIYMYLRHDDSKYRSVWIDSLTELQRRHSMGNILGELDPATAEYTDLGRTDSPTRADWMKTGNQMRNLIRGFRELAYMPDVKRRKHVIMTALERFDEKRALVCPQLPGTLGPECGAFVDILGRLATIQVPDPENADRSIMRRYLLLNEYVDGEGIRYLAKNRGDRWPDGIWDPSAAQLLDGWLGGSSNG